MRTINNFSTVSTAALADTDGGLSISMIDSTRLAEANPSSTNLIALTLINDADVEIVYASAVDSETGVVSIERGQEGTSAPALFPVGTTVESRETAMALDGIGESVVSLGSPGAALPLTVTDGRLQRAVITEETTITLAAGIAYLSGFYRTTLILINGTESPQTVIWDAGMQSARWSGPAVSSIAVGHEVHIEIAIVGGMQYFLTQIRDYA